MTNELEKLENKIQNSQQGSDYSLSSDSRGRKTYTIFSDNLKQTLRDIVHLTVFEGWQISHTLGRGFIEYKREQNGKFGLYRKNLLADDDEFLIVPEGQSSTERKNFEEARQRVSESEKRVSESESRLESNESSSKRLAESEKRAKESEWRAMESQKRLDDDSKSDDYVSFSVQWNKKNEKITTAEKHFSDASQEQAFKETPGWKVAQAVAKVLAEAGNKQDNQTQQQTQIIHKEQPKFPSPWDKGGNK